MEPTERTSAWAQPGVWLLTAFTTVLAWHNRFLLDDAFISFRYAENFARGHGLVWNAGERVEGYSNFLWTLLLSLGGSLHVSMPAFATGLGLMCFVVSLLATFELALRLTGSNRPAYVALVLLGTNYTFSAFATSGLETQMQAALLTLVALASLPPADGSRESAGRLAAFSTLVAAAELTRLDSVVIVGPLALVVLWRTLTEPRPDRAAAVAALALPFVVSVGSWLAWKQAYYSQILPNTFFAKIGSRHLASNAIHYLRSYLTSYLLAPLAVVVLLELPRLLRERFAGGFALLVLLWLGYLVAIGADFMEFRMVVPVTPLCFVLGAWASPRLVAAWPQRMVLVALTIFGSWWHATRFEQHRPSGVESIRMLVGHLERKQENWPGVGRALAHAFPEDSGVRIATTAAGAIPYFSRLPALDMLGLTDAWVARHGLPIGERPGHQRLAPIHYMRDRGVNLVISHPIVLASGEAVTVIPFLGTPQGAELAGRPVLAIPIGQGYRVLAIYLTPHPAVDAALAREGWGVTPLTPGLAATAFAALR